MPAPPASGVHDITLEALMKRPLALGATGLTIENALADAVAKIRENIAIRQVCRVAAVPGVVGSYVHGAVRSDAMIGPKGALVAIGTGEEAPSEATLEIVQPLAKKLAMHVVAAQPQFLNPASVPEEVLDAERALLTDQAASSGKPPEIVAKMVEGRLKKFYAEKTLLEQPHVVEPDGLAVRGESRGRHHRASLSLPSGMSLLLSRFPRTAALIFLTHGLRFGPQVSKVLAQASKATGVPLTLDGFVLFKTGA